MITYKKILSFVLCFAVVLATFVPIFAAASETEDFGDGDASAVLSSEWSGITSGATASGSEIDTAPASVIPYNTESQNALYVNTASAASVETTLAGTAAFDEVSFDVYPESIGTDGVRVSFGNAVSLLFKREAGSAVDTPIHLYYTAGGTDTDTDFTLTNGVWFTVQVTAAEADGKANLSVNGAEAVSIDASHVAATSFKVESLGRNDAYIDNVKVTEIGTEEAVYAEDFEAVPADELPDGYSALGSGIAVGAGASLAACVVPNANGLVKTFSPALEGIGDITFEVYFDEAGYKGAHVRFYSGTTLRCGLIFSRGVQDVNAPIMLSYDDPTNKTLATNSLHKTFVPISGYEIKEGVHYQFRIAPSTKTNASILYVNGEQVSEIYTNTSLTGIDKIEVLSTGSNETLPVSIYVDNIRIYAKNTDVPMFAETFAGSTAGVMPTGWVKDGKTKINLFAENYSYKQTPETSALHVWQSAGASASSATRSFESEDTFRIAFDYMPIAVGTQGQAFTLLQDGETVYSFNVYNTTKNYGVRVVNGPSVSVCADTHVILNAWNRIEISAEDGVAFLNVNGEKAAEWISSGTPVEMDAIRFETLSDGTAREEFYIDNVTVSESSGTGPAGTDSGSQMQNAPVSSVRYNTGSKNALYVNTASAASVETALDGTAAFDSISFDVYPESIGTAGIRTNFGNAVSLLFKREAGSAVDAPIHLYYTAGGTDTDTGITLSNGAWFTVTVTSAGAGKADLSVNESETVSIDASHVAVTSFKVESLGRNDAYIDNVKITENGAAKAFYAENFEAVPTGELPDGYTAVGSGIAVGAGASLAICVLENANGAVKTFSPALENVGEIYFEVYFDEAGCKGAHVRFSSGTTLHSGLIFSRGVEDVNSPIMLSYDDPNSTTKAINSLHKTFVPIDGYEIKEGIHYQFRIVPTSGNKAALYANGELISEIYANTSLTDIDKIEVQGTGSNEHLSVNIFVDNIRIYAKGSDVPVFVDTFAGCTAGAPPVDWEVSGKTSINLRTENCSYKKTGGTSALYVWQNNGSAVASVTNEFALQETLMLEFDYLPTRVSDFGQSFTIMSNGEKVYSFNVYYDTNKYGVRVINGSSVTVCSDASIRLNAWNQIKIIIEDRVAMLNINGVYVADSIEADASVTGFDAICFETRSAGSSGEAFYLDHFVMTDKAGLEVSGMASSFTDTFDTESDQYEYSGNGTHVVSGGKLNLSGAVEVYRSVKESLSGKFGFTLNTDTTEDLVFGLMNGNAKVILVKARADGALLYQRESDWILMAEPGSVPTNEETEISFDLPVNRNANYLLVKVNGELVGTALYNVTFSSVNKVYFGISEGASATVDNFFAAKSDGIIKMPERVASSPDVYLYTVLAEATPLYLANDLSPAKATLDLPEETDVLTLDVTGSSIGVDLGDSVKVNAIRLIGDAQIARPATFNNYSVWTSEDNENWTKLYGFNFNHFTENGVSVSLFEFTGVTARYVKVNSTASTGAFKLSHPYEQIRAEVREDRQYKMAGNAMYALDDTDPQYTPMTLEQYYRPITVTKGDSIGINFGLNSAVEAIELSGLGLSGLDENDFALYRSSDNIRYERINDVILSVDKREGLDVYRLTFDSVVCGYLKLTLLADTSVELADLYQGLSAYSSVEVASGETYRYTKVRGGGGDFYTRADGTLVMSFDGYFDGSSGDFGDTILKLTQSVDGGYTWSDSWVGLLKQPDSINLMNFSFRTMSNGDIGLIYEEMYDSSNNRPNYLIRSSDGGRTWSDPVMIASEESAYATGYCNVIFGTDLHLVSGRYILPVNYAYESNDCFGSDRCITYIVYSDDDGLTWHNAPGIVTLPHAALEPNIAELANGDLLMTLRTRKENAVYQTISTDGGMTWAQPEQVAGLDTPSSTTTVNVIPSTGDVLFIWNNQKYDPSNGNGTRDPLTAAVTSDEGLTYHNLRNLVEASATWQKLRFYGRSVVIAYGAYTSMKVMDVSDFYQTLYGSKTTDDLPKAATPAAVYEDGWLKNVTNNMAYSLDSGKTWRYCGGSSVKIGTVTGSILVKDIGSTEYAPSLCQTLQGTAKAAVKHRTLSDTAIPETNVSADVKTVSQSNSACPAAYAQPAAEMPKKLPAGKDEIV